MKKNHKIWKVVFWLAFLATLIAIISIIEDSFYDVSRYVCSKDVENSFSDKDYYLRNVLDSALAAFCVLIANIFSAVILFKLSKQSKIKRAENSLDTINKLHGYYQNGAITQDEYEYLRAEIIKQAGL